MDKQIPLLNRARSVVGFAIVDDADFESLSKYRWHMKINGHNRYARRCFRDVDKLVTLMMHEAVVGKAPDGLITDHINRNSLDNRRSNLRFVTPSGSTQNRGLVTYNTSGVRGVFFDRTLKTWRVQIKRGGKKVFGQSFKTFEEAVPVAIAKRLELLPYATD